MLCLIIQCYAEVLVLELHAQPNVEKSGGRWKEGSRHHDARAEVERTKLPPSAPTFRVYACNFEGDWRTLASSAATASASKHGSEERMGRVKHRYFLDLNSAEASYAHLLLRASKHGFSRLVLLTPPHHLCAPGAAQGAPRSSAVSPEVRAPCKQKCCTWLYVAHARRAKRSWFVCL